MPLPSHSLLLFTNITGDQHVHASLIGKVHTQGGKDSEGWKEWKVLLVIYFYIEDSQESKLISRFLFQLCYMLDI